MWKIKPNLICKSKVLVNLQKECYKVSDGFGKEPIKITVSPPLGPPCCSLYFRDLWGITFENNPERKPALADLTSASLLPMLCPSWLVPLLETSWWRRAPQEQVTTLLKQVLWNADLQDLHFSISPSCQNRIISVNPDNFC